MEKFKKWLNKRIDNQAVINYLKSSIYGKLFIIGFMLQYLHIRYNEKGIKWDACIDFNIAILNCNSVFDLLKEKIIEVDLKS